MVQPLLGNGDGVVVLLGAVGIVQCVVCACEMFYQERLFGNLFRRHYTAEMCNGDNIVKRCKDISGHESLKK